MKIETQHTLVFTHTTPPTTLPPGIYPVLSFSDATGYRIMKKGCEDLFVPEDVARPWPMPEREANEIGDLRRWKKEALSVIGGWGEVFKFVQHHPSAIINQSYQDNVLRLLQEGENWKETAERHLRNEEFYRSIVEQIGKLFGQAAFTAEDGTVGDSVLALAVYPLVRSLVEQSEYRFLQVSEVIQEGDEFHQSGCWKPHIDGPRGCIGEKWDSSHCITRRKLASKPKYRILDTGERTQEGDEYLEMGSDSWKPVGDYNVNSILYTGHVPFRRSWDSGEEYRPLELGEVILAGDEVFRDTGVWEESVASPGRTFSRSHREFRRKVVLDTSTPA